MFSNYPFLREQEVTFPASAVPLNGGLVAAGSRLFRSISTCRTASSGPPARTAPTRSATARTSRAGADGTLEPDRSGHGTADARQHRRDVRVPRHRSRTCGRRTSSSTTSACSASSATNLMLEVRYVGSKGSKLLEARAFNQGYDLNAADTPDYIFERFNQAYVAAGSPNGALNAGATARARGVGRAFGFAERERSAACSTTTSPTPAARSSASRRAAPILGFNIPEAVLLANTGRSLYNSLQLNLLKRMSRRPAVQPRVHLLALEGHELGRSGQHGRRRQAGRAERRASSVQGNQRDLDANYALSDFDRPHRFSGSFVWELPGRGAAAAGSALSGFVQLQSGLPYSIYSAEPELGNAAQYGDLVRGSGGLYRLGVRPAEPVRLARRAPPGRRRSDGGGVQQERALLADDGGGRISGQSGLRQPRPQRAARLLAAPRRSQPRQDASARAATATSSCAGTSSTCSTPSTTRCRTTSSATPPPTSARSPTRSAGRA